MATTQPDHVNGFEWPLFTASASGFQRICPLADCGNAISRNGEPLDLAINTDLSIHLHQEPVGEWFGSEATSHWSPDGISDALLFDEQGGRAGRSIACHLADVGTHHASFSTKPSSCRRCGIRTRHQ